MCWTTNLVIHGVTVDQPLLRPDPEHLLAILAPVQYRSEWHDMSKQPPMLLTE